MSEETLRLVLQIFGSGSLGLIAFWMYHKFNKELLAQTAKQHDLQHQQQTESRENQEAFLKELLTIIIKQQHDYEEMYQRSLAADQDKQMYFRLALQAFERMGNCRYERDERPTGYPQERENPQDPE